MALHSLHPLVCLRLLQHTGILDHQISYDGFSLIYERGRGYSFCGVLFCPRNCQKLILHYFLEVSLRFYLIRNLRALEQEFMNYIFSPLFYDNQSFSILEVVR